MQIEIMSRPLEESPLGFDYLYGLHSALLDCLTKRQPALAKELHDGAHRDRLKMFTFSPFNSMPKPQLVQVDGEKRKRLLLGCRVWFRVASPWPELLNALGEGLLMGREFSVFGKRFKVENVGMIAPPELRETMVWRPFGQSATICAPWSPPGADRKLFAFPDNVPDGAPDCATLLVNNLVHKFQRLRELRGDIATAWLKDADLPDVDKSQISVKFLPLAPGRAFKTATHYCKNAVVRSWRCPVAVTAPLPIQRLVWASGLGAMNSQGYGLVQEGKK